MIPQLILMGKSESQKEAVSAITFAGILSTCGTYLDTAFCGGLCGALSEAFHEAG